MLKKFKKLCTLLRYFFVDEDSLFLYLLEQKAYECLEDCYKLDISFTEEIEDLIFHIKTYREIPHALSETKYPQFTGISIQDIAKRYKDKKLNMEQVEAYGDYLVEIEEQRALERDFIFEHAKVLTFGFKLY
jgi:hypothetical protein